MCIYTFDELKAKIEPIARSYGFDRVYLFGSYARGDANGESDVDLYVEFSNPMGLKFYGFLPDVEEALSKHVDVITKNGFVAGSERGNYPQYYG